MPPPPAPPPPLVCYTAVFSVVTQRWGGALRDDPKKGCVADYPPRHTPAEISCVVINSGAEVHENKRLPNAYK